MIIINIILIVLFIILLFLINIFFDNKKENFQSESQLSISKKICPDEKTIVLDYDEINLDVVKKESLDIKIELETEQKLINPKEILTKLPKITTYMDLPGYKAHNIELLNKFELKENNYGLIDYNNLEENERFKAKNSIIKI
jgi:hypothetical protein